MRSYLLLVLFLVSVSAFAQDPQRSKFSGGLHLGYKTAAGLGLITSYHANRVIQVDLMVGYTRYNGGKFSGGAKFYPLKPMKVNPFISVAYSISTGTTVKAGYVDQQKEQYTTYANQYIVTGLGMTILGQDIGHSLQIGYNFAIQKPAYSAKDFGYGYYPNRDKVVNSLKSGVMVTYNLFLFFNKPRRR